jgi:signal transduction histidine kinase
LSIQYARSLTFELSVPILSELGLEAAPEWLAEHVQTKYGLPVSIAIGGPPVSLDDEARTLLFKTVRELLMNMIKHAKARQARVGLRNADAEIQVIVEDDGIGFPIVAGGLLPGKNGGFGLFSIREGGMPWQ